MNRIVASTLLDGVPVHAVFGKYQLASSTTYTDADARSIVPYTRPLNAGNGHPRRSSATAHHESRPLSSIFRRSTGIDTFPVMNLGFDLVLVANDQLLTAAELAPLGPMPGLLYTRPFSNHTIRETEGPRTSRHHGSR